MRTYISCHQDLSLYAQNMEYKCILNIKITGGMKYKWVIFQYLFVVYNPEF